MRGNCRTEDAGVVITIIDLDIGNLQSVTNALRRVGAEVSIARSPAEAEGAQVVVLPGVGAFERAMMRMREHRFGEFLHRHAVERRSPLIGICLGMQLLSDRSHEHGLTAGLGLISGDVVRLEPTERERVPNIGWMPVYASKPSVMFPATVDGQSFYHVHSYHLVCREADDIAATITFGGQQVVTAVERGNIYGVQFHPEKSQEAGLNLLHSLLVHCTSPGR
jgi:imidazole glycerol-phosphate synthase subunit HisH